MTVTVYPVDQPRIEVEDSGEPSLTWAQGVVGGYVECAYSTERDADGAPDAIMIFNEEGKLYGMKINRLATMLAWELGMIPMSDCIAGPAIILTGKNRWT